MLADCRAKRRVTALESGPQLHFYPSRKAHLLFWNRSRGAWSGAYGTNASSTQEIGSPLSTEFTEWLTLEGSSGGCLVEPCCSSRATQRRLPRTMPRWLLKISKDAPDSSPLVRLWLPLSLLWAFLSPIPRTETHRPFSLHSSLQPGPRAALPKHLYSGSWRGVRRQGARNEHPCCQPDTTTCCPQPCSPCEPQPRCDLGQKLFGAVSRGSPTWLPSV